MSSLPGRARRWRRWRVRAIRLLGMICLVVGLAAPAEATLHRMQLGSPEGLLVLQPSRLTITAGDVVRFEVEGLGPHNLIVEDHPEWSHGGLAFQTGESWEQRFDTPGRFRVWCEPHRFAGMEGELTVEAAAKRG